MNFEKFSLSKRANVLCIALAPKKMPWQILWIHMKFLEFFGIRKLMWGLKEILGSYEAMIFTWITGVAKEIAM